MKTHSYKNGRGLAKVAHIVRLPRLFLFLAPVAVILHCGTWSKALDSTEEPSTTGSTPKYTVSVNVTGSTGPLVLSNNGSDMLYVGSDGTHTFTEALTSGSGYNVTISVQPSGQLCAITGGSGIIASDNITNITVTCSTAYTVGGTVSGLSGSGLVLQNNGGDDLTITTNGSFTFATPLLDTSSYNVTVLTQPSSPTQICTVSSGSGSVSGANITNVAISCSSVYTIGGTVSGLSGTGLVLQNNGGDDLVITANGSFTFATPLADSAGYTVTVSTSPSGPTQYCSIPNGVGVVSGANVTSITVTCANAFYVGGTVSGLSGTLVLKNNGGDDLSITADGSFTFATPVTAGGSYDVTVSAQPAGQGCVLSNRRGTGIAADVTNIAVACQTTGTEVTTGWPHVNNPTGGTDAIEDIITDSNDNIIATGYAGDQGNGTEYWIRKLQPDGTTLWTFQAYDATYLLGAKFYAMAVDSSDNVYAVGEVQGCCGVGLAGYIGKFNGSTGTEITTGWAKEIAGANAELRFYDVLVDSSDNVYVCGYELNGAGNKDWIIKKFDSSGTEITTGWPKTFDGNGGDDIAFSMALDQGGNLLVGGGAVNLSGASSGSDLWLKKFSPDGTEDTSWNIIQDISTGTTWPYYNAIRDMSVDSSGNVYVVGSAYVSGDPKFMIKKFSSTGVEDTANWNKIASSSLASQGYAVTAIGGRVYASGYQQFTGDGYDMWVRSFDPNGTEDTTNWNKYIDYGAGYAYGMGLAGSKDGSIYLGGYFDSEAQRIYKYFP